MKQIMTMAMEVLAAHGLLAADDIVLESFDGAYLGEWQARGKAFGTRPISSAREGKEPDCRNTDRPQYIDVGIVDVLPPTRAAGSARDAERGPTR